MCAASLGSAYAIEKLLCLVYGSPYSDAHCFYGMPRHKNLFNIRIYPLDKRLVVLSFNHLMPKPLVYLRFIYRQKKAYKTVIFLHFDPLCSVMLIVSPSALKAPLCEPAHIIRRTHAAYKNQTRRTLGRTS
jgi:hypothetical protein